MVNTVNNKRRRASQQRIEKALIRQLQSKELHQISVTDICKEAGVNRTTFYANYEDIFALGHSIMQRLEAEVMSLYQAEQNEKRAEHNFLKLFRHIYENQLFYNTYFKLRSDGCIPNIGYSAAEADYYFEGKNINYHLAFFGYGITAVIRKWLLSGCRETPEEIYDIIVSEYKRSPFLT